MIRFVGEVDLCLDRVVMRHWSMSLAFAMVLVGRLFGLVGFAGCCVALTGWFGVGCIGDAVGFSTLGSAAGGSGDGRSTLGAV